VTLARRLHPALGRWWHRVARRWLPVPVKPARLGLHTIRDMGVDIELDIDAGADRRLLRGEKWLVRHVVRRLPGGNT